MRALLLFTVTLCLAVSATAQRPQPCKSPPLWEGNVTLHFPWAKLTKTEKLSYDAFEERIRQRSVVDLTFNQDVLYLFREGIYYEINYRNQTCVKKPITIPFTPVEIPKDAQLQSQVVLGSLSAPAEGLVVNNWVGEDLKLRANYSMTFTEFGCLPLNIIYNFDEMGYIFRSFYDMILGIENPEVFIPPSFCDKAELVKPEDGPVTDFFPALL